VIAVIGALNLRQLKFFSSLSAAAKTKVIQKEELLASTLWSGLIR
jgi:hypothetical protein